MTRTASRAVTVGLGVALAGIAACAEVEGPALELRAALEGELPVPGDAAEEVEELTERRELYDENGDGFVSPAEAEGYYRRYFGELDDNNDGRLSRAELRPEEPGVLDPELAYEELVGATEKEYLDDNLHKYNLRADCSIGMISTREFDEMVGDPDPAISLPVPGVSP